MSGRLIEAYLVHLTLANYRPTTLLARGTCLRSFHRTLDGRDLTQAGRIDVEAYMGRTLRPESRRAYKGHLRAFYRWALDEEYVTADPTAKLAPIRVPKAVPRPISEEQLVVAVAAGDARMKAWLLLAALGGLRCLEVAALRPRDLEPTASGMLLRLRECKGGGVATVPAHPLILDALDRVPIRNAAWWECKANHVSLTISAHLRAAGVDATAHQLRHYAGTSWYRASGHDLLATATLLRHVSVKTTMVYAQLDPTRPREVVDAVQVPALSGRPADRGTLSVVHSESA